MNMGIQVSIFTPLDKYPEVELLSHMLILFLILIILHQFTFPPTVHICFFFSTSSLALIASLFDKSYSNEYEMISHCSLICIYLIISGAEHTFMYLLTICMSSLEKVSIPDPPFF